jgi:hypothetical protein
MSFVRHMGLDFGMAFGKVYQGHTTHTAFVRICYDSTYDEMNKETEVAHVCTSSYSKHSKIIKEEFQRQFTLL